MNIQIYYLKKDFEVQKVLRYFKERKISFQLIDLSRKPLSGGELKSLIKAVGLQSLIDEKSKAYKSLNLGYYGLTVDTEQLLLQHPDLLRTPIVRNGRQACIGCQIEILRSWQ